MIGGSSSRLRPMLSGRRISCTNARLRRAPFDGEKRGASRRRAPSFMRLRSAALLPVVGIRPEEVGNGLRPLIKDVANHLFAERAVEGAAEVVDGARDLRRLE